MAFVSTQDHTHVRGNILKSVGAAISRYFVASMEAASRSTQIQALQSMSDRQLADIGLKREDIARHVYSDMFHL